MKLCQILIPLLIFVIFHTGVKAQIEVDTSTRKNFLIKFDYQKPTFKLNEEQSQNHNRHLHYSIITGYRRGVKPYKGIASFEVYHNKENGTSRFCMYNLSVIDLLNLGFGSEANRIILLVKDRDKYFYDPTKGVKEDWLIKNSYCFEYLIPEGTLYDMNIIRQEVASYFELAFDKEKVYVDALVLFRTSSADKISAIEGGSPIFKDGVMKNVKLKMLSSWIDDALLPPLKDETGYEGNVDIILKNSDKKDFAYFKKELNKYDLDIKIEKRELEMLIISEKK